VINFFDNFGGSTPDGTSNPLIKATITNGTLGADSGAYILLESFLEPPDNTNYIDQISFYLNTPLPGDISAFTTGAGGSCQVISGSFSCTESSFAVQPPPIIQPDFSNVVNAALRLPQNAADRFDALDAGSFFVKGLTEGLLLPITSIDNNGVSRTCLAGAKINSIGPNGEGSTSIGGNCNGGGTPVPGPLPLLGAAAAFGYSRKIRTRIQGSRQQATIS
jgi:hypothetical protein